MTHLTVTDEKLNDQLERLEAKRTSGSPSIYRGREVLREVFCGNGQARSTIGRFIVRLPQRLDVRLGESKEQKL